MEHQGTTIWLTGLSGAGKSTIANLLARRLRAGGAKVEVLDGDVIRTNLSKGLGFSKEDRDTNIRRIGFVCGLLSRNGVIAIAAAISPYRNLRQEVRATNTNFVEVFTDCPLDTLVERDVKASTRRPWRGRSRISPACPIHTRSPTTRKCGSIPTRRRPRSQPARSGNTWSSQG